MFSDTFTTVGDNSQLIILYETGQSKKTSPSSNVHFGVFVDGVLVPKQQKKQHDFYDNGGGTDFRYYQHHTAVLEDAGSAGTKSITVYGGCYLPFGTVTFNFQASSEPPYRRGLMTIMEVAA